jgi:hypothetical protein
MTKTAVLLAVIAVITIGAPYIKTPCDCGADLRVAFTGAILGCGGEKETGSSDHTSNSSLLLQTIPGIRVKL